MTTEWVSCCRFLAIVEPTKADADGLIESLGRALKLLGIENVSDKAGDRKPILVGGGTDGASVNIAEHKGRKGKLQ